MNSREVPHLEEPWSSHQFAFPSVNHFNQILTIFDKATLSLGTTNEISNVALMEGSSQQGKALRASVAWRKSQD